MEDRLEAPGWGGGAEAIATTADQERQKPFGHVKCKATTAPAIFRCCCSPSPIRFDRGSWQDGAMVQLGRESYMK